MNLHRALAHEWTNTPAANRNIWQKIAARTVGILTPGNVVSVIGAALVFVGLYYIIDRQFTTGILFVIIGRLADLLDGYVAHVTGTKSPVGEAVDATIDKLEAFIFITVLLLGDFLPGLVFAVLLAHTAFGVGIFWLAQRRGGRVHPSQSGKLATALEWVLVGLFVAKAAASDEVNSAAHIVIIICFSAFIAFSLHAFWQYIQDYRKIGA
jgi:phosphatidylglycerophosphate synthase